MRAFAPSLVAYFAAVSATVVQLVESAAIPRDSQQSTSETATNSNPHVVVYHDNGRPRWGFVIPNQKRAAGSVSVLFRFIMWHPGRMCLTFDMSVGRTDDDACSSKIRETQHR